MRTKKRALALYLAIIAIIASISAARPQFSWDALAYIGVVLSWQGDGTQALHDAAYADLRSAMPRAAFEHLLAGSAAGRDRRYRPDVYAHPAHFAAQLPFYRPRPLYLALVYAEHRLGVPLPTALVVVSAAAYVAIGALLFLWLARHLTVRHAMLFALLIMLMPAILASARYDTPDTLSAAILLGAFYALLERRAAGTCALLLAVSVLARSDNVVVALVLMAYLAVSPAFAAERRAALAYALGVFVLFAGVEWLSGTYGWRTLFYHTFVAFLPNPAHSPPLTASAYLHALAAGLKSVRYSQFIPFALIGGIAYLIAGVDGKAAARYRPYLQMIALTLALRYVLFPALFDRLLLPYYLVTAALCVSAAAQAVHARRARAFKPRSVIPITAALRTGRR